MKPLLFAFVLLLTAASLWSAPQAQPAANEKHWTKIDLPKKLGNVPIGVEPEGGFFVQVLPNPGEYTFSIYAGKELKLLSQISLGAPSWGTPVAANGTLYVPSRKYLWAVQKQDLGK